MTKKAIKKDNDPLPKEEASKEKEPLEEDEEVLEDDLDDSDEEDDDAEDEPTLADYFLAGDEAGFKAQVQKIATQKVAELMSDQSGEDDS